MILDAVIIQILYTKIRWACRMTQKVKFFGGATMGYVVLNRRRIPTPYLSGADLPTKIYRDGGRTPRTIKRSIALIKT